MGPPGEAGASAQYCSMQALNARLSSAERPRITRSCCGTGSRWCSGELLALADVARAGRERRPADDDRPASLLFDGRETPCSSSGSRRASCSAWAAYGLASRPGRRALASGPARVARKEAVPGDRQCGWVHFSGRALRRLRGGPVRVLTGRGGGRRDLKVARPPGQPPSGAARFGELPRPGSRPGACKIDQCRKLHPARCLPARACHALSQAIGHASNGDNRPAASADR